MAGRVIGWKLDRAERGTLLGRFPPQFPDVVCDHVTLTAHPSPGARLPSETHGEIVGAVSDGEGVQAMVVRIGGTTNRPGGGTYHITWSLDRKRGRRPVESNDVIARLGWVPLAESVGIILIPKRF